MKPLSLLGITAIALAACTPTRSTPAPAPAPAPSPAPNPTTPPSRVLKEAPRDWQLLDVDADTVIGIGLERAMRDLLASKQPQRTVVVAVIDGGVDTAHVDLRANLWMNEDEVPGNGRDDDGNGYVDDVRGWNFIGGADGENVRYDTFEVTRLFARCRLANPDSVPADLRARCPEISADYDRKRGEAERTLMAVQQISRILLPAAETLRKALGDDSLNVANVTAMQPSSGDVRRARETYLQMAGRGISPEMVVDAHEAYESQLRYGYNTDYDPRSIVGDDYSDVTERIYGNPDVTGPDAEHGTHVAGIIAAVRGNGVGIDGIAPSVRIMGVRAVPDGDERDKDVANAIRYAVDNGAHVINMSFGKAYSPRKDAVDEAVRYAESKGVLLVHAAGNDGEDLEKKPNFPTPRLDSNTVARNWITVGASSWKGLDSLAAPFSNYGNEEVDVFAPGVDILSTIPGGEYERNSGTSMAAPVVTGLAALLMSYYPSLTATDVRRIIMESAAPYRAQMVVVPGGDTRAAFGTLSVTGGIVNVPAAVRMAEEMTGATP
ncbi:MAG TPA: S8 family peptidase [Gemmatimonadales bacterium]